ncbi:histone-lysine N-methyltransferase SETMAR [Plakobranchus ocellatus]|uniref:Histone-lysine N-methyltransferase SETMAR n=1 Tax=Plakobranchus ocellatus TaxID=259542 RepID=A0AAV3XV90_9GAST|nr:histone-lysine N-methyltransferase SETMAR [Plakobranchus ocellatus]
MGVAILESVVFNRAFMNGAETAHREDIDPNQTWPNDQGMTEAQASTLCSQAISKSQLTSKCASMSPNSRETFMADCLSDILYGGTIDFLDAITDAFTAECQQVIAKDPSSYVSDPITGQRMLKSEYSGDICLTDCLDHGHCGPGGVCICDQGWEGEYCHMMVGKGPELDKIRSGPLCDKSQRPCQKVFIDATNINLSDDLACAVQEIDEQGKAITKTLITDAEFISSSRISCEIPETTVSSKRYQVSATNDGALYGNALDILVFDSICLDCNGEGCTEKVSG